jgi:hypothetical protein
MPRGVSTLEPLSTSWWLRPSVRMDVGICRSASPR